MDLGPSIFPSCGDDPGEGSVSCLKAQPGGWGTSALGWGTVQFPRLTSRRGLLACAEPKPPETMPHLILTADNGVAPSFPGFPGGDSREACGARQVPYPGLTRKTTVPTVFAKKPQPALGSLQAGHPVPSSQTCRRLPRACEIITKEKAYGKWLRLGCGVGWTLVESCHQHLLSGIPRFPEPQVFACDKSRVQQTVKRWWPGGCGGWATWGHFVQHVYWSHSASGQRNQHCCHPRGARP